MTDSRPNYAHVSIKGIFESWSEHRSDDLTPTEIQDSWPVFYQGSAYMLFAILDLINSGESKEIINDQIQSWLKDGRQHSILLGSQE